MHLIKFDLKEILSTFEKTPIEVTIVAKSTILVVGRFTWVVEQVYLEKIF